MPLGRGWAGPLCLLAAYNPLADVECVPGFRPKVATVGADNGASSRFRLWRGDETMVSTVGAGSSGFIPGAAPTRTSLEGEVDTCRKQMADWVTCPSASTPEGKAKIKDISERMSVAQSRLDALPTRSTPQVTATSSDTRLVDVYA